MLHAMGFLPRAAASASFLAPGAAALRARVLGVGVLLGVLLGGFMCVILVFMTILLSNNWLMAEIIDEHKQQKRRGAKASGDDQGPPEYDRFGYGCPCNWLLFCLFPHWRVTPPSALGYQYKSYHRVQTAESDADDA